jgi:hypothetical protein
VSLRYLIQLLGRQDLLLPGLHGMFLWCLLLSRWSLHGLLLIERQFQLLLLSWHLIHTPLLLSLIMGLVFWELVSRTSLICRLLILHPRGLAELLTRMQFHGLLLLSLVRH